VIAPVLWRIAHGIQKASRGALLTITILYALRLLVTLPTLHAFDAFLLMLEGFVLGKAWRALHHMRDQASRPDRSWRTELRAGTAAAFLLALLWIVVIVPRYAARFQKEGLGHVRTPLALLALFMIGIAAYLTIRTELVQRVFGAFGAIGPRFGDMPAAPRIRKTLRSLGQAPWLDFAVAVVVGGLAIAILAFIASLTTGPGVMLVPSVLLIPIAAIAALLLAFMWLISGFAALASSSRAPAFRRAAVTISVIVAVIFGPIFRIMLEIAVSALIHGASRI
jgi:hypothetical protein